MGATDEPWLGKLDDRDTGNRYTSQMILGVLENSHNRQISKTHKTKSSRELIVGF